MHLWFSRTEMGINNGLGVKRTSEHGSGRSYPFLGALSPAKEEWAPAPSARAPRDLPIFLLSELLGLIQEHEQE